MGRGGGGKGGFRGQNGRTQNRSTPMNNRAQNRQTDAVASQLKLTPQQSRQLHDEISGMGYGYKEILEIARELFDK